MNTGLSKLNKNLICVSIGDIEGIGIHLLLKEFLNNKINNFVLITNIKIFRNNIKFPSNKINVINEKNIKNIKNNKLNIFSFKTKNKNTNTLDALEFSYKFTKNKIFIGILTLPLNKYKINKNIVDLKLPEKYIYENGGRDYLLDKYNLSPSKIAQLIEKII